MICDGMAQAALSIPKKLQFDYTGDVLEQKLIGVLVHGQDQ